MKKGLIAFLSVFMLVALAACAGTEGDEIELSETSVTLDQGETMTIEASVLPDEDDVDQSMTWESSDEDVVPVTQEGEIGGQTGGTAEITVTSDEYEDVSATLEVRVLPRVEGVAVAQPNLSLTLGEDGSEATHEIDWEVTPMDDQENTWELDDLEFEVTDEDVLSVEDGVITATHAGSSDVQVIAGNEFTYMTVTVADYTAEHTIGGVWDAENDDEVEVYGVVNAIIDHTEFVIEDAEGAVSIYDADQEFIDDVAVGNEVLVEGTRDEYNGLVQIAPTGLTIRDEDADLNEPVDLTFEDLEDADALLEYQNQRVTMSQMEIVEFEVDDYENRILTLRSLYNDSEISLRYDSRLESTDAEAQIDEFEEGEEVSLAGITLSWYDGPQVLYSDESQIMEREEYDEELVKTAMDHDLDRSGEQTEDLDLPDSYEADDYDLEIAWESNTTDVLADDGTITRPEALEDEENVVLTATITDPEDDDFEHEVVSNITVLPYTPEEAALKVIEDEMPETVENGDDLTALMDEENEDYVDYDFTQYIDEDSTLFYEDGEWDLDIDWSVDSDYLDENGNVSDVGYNDRVVDVTVTLLNDVTANRFETEHTFEVTLEGDEFEEDSDLETYLSDTLSKETLELPEGSVYEDIDLPDALSLGGYDLDITWSSGDEDVMTDDGDITRADAGDDNDTVTMTATFTDGNGIDQEVTMDFEVADLMSDDELDDALDDIFEEDAAEVTEDLEFEDEEEAIAELEIESGRSLTMEYEAEDDQAFLSDDGEVTRPEYEEDDAVVDFEITISDDDDYSYEQTLEVTIPAVEVSDQDQALYDELADIIDESHAMEDLEFDSADDEAINLPTDLAVEGFDMALDWHLEENEFVTLSENTLAVNRLPDLYQDATTVDLEATYSVAGFEHTKTFDVQLDALRVADVVEVDDLYELEENDFDWTLTPQDTFSLIDWYSLDNFEFAVEWDVELADDDEDRDLEDYVDFDEGVIEKPGIDEYPLEITLLATVDGETLERDITVLPVSAQDQRNDRFDTYLGEWLPEESDGDIELPSELVLLDKTAQFDWEVSSGEDYISDDGEVTLPEDEDETVTLEVTATGDVDFTAEYDVVIQTLDEALDNEWEFDSDVTSDLTLDTELNDYFGHDLDVEWDSNNTDYLENDGTVTRPEAGEDDEEVTLTATVTDDDAFEHDVEFELTILAEED